MKRKILAIIMSVAILCIGNAISVFAGEGATLDEIIAGNGTSESSSSVVSEESNVSSEESKPAESSKASEADQSSKSLEERNQDFIDGLGNAANMTGNVEGVASITSSMSYVISGIVQVIVYAAMCLMGLRLALDIMYIGVPFLRYPLTGRSASSGSSAPAPQSSNNGFGSFGSFPQTTSNTPVNAGNSGGQSSLRKIQWVSNAAIQAIDKESSGGTFAAFKVYVKDMIVVFVLVPVFMVLAMTGMLSRLGLSIGNALANMLYNISNSI